MYLNKFYIIILSCSIFSLAFASKPIESWIEYDEMSKIKPGLTIDDVLSSLGEPVLMLASAEDDDNFVYLFYNYRVKKYSFESLAGSKENVRVLDKERTTLLRFTFSEDKLIVWEEDNITLGMAKTSTKSPLGIIKYMNLFINLIVLIAIVSS